MEQLVLPAILSVGVIVVVWLVFKYTRGGPKKSGTIKELYLYPIKSTYGIQVQSASIGKYGFKYDREWMLVDTTNNFVSQRVYPKLALVKPAINEAKGVLEISAPEMPTITVPLKHAIGEELDVTVWGGEMRGVDQGEDAAKWFSKFIGAQLRLVRLPLDHARVVEPEFAETKAEQLCSFADGYPYLIANENSLADVRQATLADCGENPVTIRRFRPNIVVSGFERWEEAFFKKAKIGSKVTMHLPKPCVRCKLTTVVPDKGIFGGDEPLKFVRAEHKAIFGMNAQHDPKAQNEVVKVGDSFVITELRKNEIEVK